MFLKKKKEKEEILSQVKEEKEVSRKFQGDITQKEIRSLKRNNYDKIKNKMDKSFLMKNNKLFWALLTATIYSILMIMLKPTGLSLTKVSITLLVWISFYLSFSTFILKFKTIKIKLPKKAFVIFIALIIWNLICIFRSFINETGSITTLFGNIYTSLALLVPFSLVFGVKQPCFF